MFSAAPFFGVLLAVVVLGEPFGTLRWTWATLQVFKGHKEKPLGSASPPKKIGRSVLPKATKLRPR